MPVAKQIGGMPRQFVISESLITQFLKYQECTKVWKGMKDVVLFFFLQANNCLGDESCFV